MKKILFIALIFTSVQLNAQLYIRNGAEIKLASGALLTINDMNLVNNGTFNQTSGTVRFTGNTNISGTQTPNQPRFVNHQPFAMIKSHRLSALQCINKIL